MSSCASLLTLSVCSVALLGAVVTASHWISEPLALVAGRIIPRMHSHTGGDESRRDAMRCTWTLEWKSALDGAGLDDVCNLRPISPAGGTPSFHICRPRA
ncbi:hypothetical protein BC831DRAFT_462190 [Entophlyctis helioformis]|nr:hypothetical protein BC831DRAFT_462190 [Entophlyctis helioformis]